MKTNKTLDNLNEALEPYKFFWMEWVQFEDCNLTDIEVSKIQALMNTTSTFGWTFASNDELEMLRGIIKKLQIGYQIFKEFVVVNFLSKIILLARDYGYDLFLNTPIKDLDIADGLKNCLLKFKTLNLKLLFLTYKAEEFSVGWVYKLIVEFQTLQKMESSTYINKFVYR